MKKYLSGLFVMLSVLLLLVSTAFASADYTITDIRLTDLKGNSIEYAGGSCMVNVSVTKNTDVADGYVVISSYTEDETLIGFNYLFASLEEGKSATLGAMVSLPDTEKIGKVKAMVWDSLDGMTPLAASKTLVPGEEVETIDVIVDGTLVNDNTYMDPYASPVPSPYNGVAVTGEYMMDPDGTPYTGDEYTITDAVLRIKKSATSSQASATEYQLRGAKLYVNGSWVCEVTSANADAVQSMLSRSTGNTILVQNTNYEGKVYDRIYMDYYVLASLNQIAVSSSETQIGIGGIPSIPAAANGLAVNPGTTLIVDHADLAEGNVTVNVTRNGVACELSDLVKNDVIALRYNIRHSLNSFGAAFDSIDIIATSETVKGEYTSYDSEKDKYIIDGAEYSAAKTQALTLGNIYTFRLDPFGRLFDAEEDMFAQNFGIVERYVDMSLPANAGFSSDYDFIDVVTLKGETKRLYIEPSAAASVRAEMSMAQIGFSQAANAMMGIQSRIVEYRFKPSTGRLSGVWLSYNTDSFSCCTYNPSANRLSKLLHDDAIVIDATDYNPVAPSWLDYSVSSLSNLAEDVDYSGVLVGRNNSNKWCYVIIEVAGATYSTSSDFAVVAANASAANCAIIDGETVYQLSVLEKGNSSATKLNISTSAQVYVNGVNDGDSYYNYNDYHSNTQYLREGAVFYYTTDKYGLVDRIDVVLRGGYNYDTLKSLITEEYYNYSSGTGTTESTINSVVRTPSPLEIQANTWFVDVDEKDCIATDKVIQLFIAPVMTAGSNYVLFSQVENSLGLAVNTNCDYTFSIADDANIYEYDLGEAGTGANAFRGGTFRGFDITDAAADGKAWLTNVPSSELCFDRLVQFAFVMAVDGEITNALLFNA